jgi:PKD repeat protein
MRSIALGILLIQALACGGAQPISTQTDDQVATIEVSPASITLTSIGDQQSFSATAKNALGTSLSGVALTWRALDSTVTRVEATGLATARANGSTRVVASASGIEGGAEVVVSQAVTALEVTPGAATIPEGESVQLAATGRDARGNDVQGLTTTWSTSNPTVASVTSAGLVAAQQPGSAAIVARSGSARDTAQITVTVVGNQAPTASISSPSSNVSVNLGTAVNFQGTANDSDGTIASHLWNFGNGTTATVEDPGNRTYGSVGTYNVTYRVTDDDGAQSPVATRTVTVTAPPPPGTTLFQDGFEDPDFASRGWYDFGAWVQTTAQAHSGTGSLQMRFQPGANQPIGGGGRHLFTETESVYLSYWVKYSTNWVGSGASYNPHEFLLLTNADDIYAGPAWTALTMYVEHVHQTGGNVPTVRASDRINIDQTRIGQNLSAITELRGANGCNGETDGHSTACWDAGGGTFWNEKTWAATRPYFLDAPGAGYKNDWHFVEVYVRLNSIVAGIGLTDGVVQYWFDGQVVLDHRDVLLRTGRSPDMEFNQLLIGLWMSDGSPVQQTMWIDDLTIGTARP